MKTLVVMAHPDWHQSSTQTFLKEAVLNMETVYWYDLQSHMEQLNVPLAQQLMKEADRIIFQFPMYWYSAPSSLYSWFEQVLTPGIYNSKLKGKEFGIVVSTGVSEKQYTAGGGEHFTFSEFLKPFQGIALKCQMVYLPPFSISLFDYLSDLEKKQLLINYQQYLTLNRQGGFKAEEQWVINRLKALSKKDMLKDPDHQLMGILQILEENRDDIDDLSDTIAQMSEE